jgi:hypothetical protein
MMYEIPCGFTAKASAQALSFASSDSCRAWTEKEGMLISQQRAEQLLQHPAVSSLIFATDGFERATEKNIKARSKSWQEPKPDEFTNNSKSRANALIAALLVDGSEFSLLV